LPNCHLWYKTRKGDIPPTTLLAAGIVVSGVGAIFGLIAVTVCEEK
jgi:hypothetical protein